jgi:dephospho-CoA kinase
VLSSDQIVHDLYLRTDVRDVVVARLGTGVLGADGEVDRGVLGELAFADPAVLEFLEQLLHPLVTEESERWRREQEASGARVAVQENPLLFERGAADRYDRTVVISASEDVRRARDPARFDRRSPFQLPDAERRALADEVFVNDGDLGALEQWVGDLVRRLSA